MQTLCLVPMAAGEAATCSLRLWGGHVLSHPTKIIHAFLDRTILGIVLDLQL